MRETCEARWKSINKQGSNSSYAKTHYFYWRQTLIVSNIDSDENSNYENDGDIKVNFIHVKRHG